jgi:hypothetical protein
VASGRRGAAVAAIVTDHARVAGIFRAAKPMLIERQQRAAIQQQCDRAHKHRSSTACAHRYRLLVNLRSE